MTLTPNILRSNASNVVAFLDRSTVLTPAQKQSIADRIQIMLLRDEAKLFNIPVESDLQAWDVRRNQPVN